MTLKTLSMWVGQESKDGITRKIFRDVVFPYVGQSSKDVVHIMTGIDYGEDYRTAACGTTLLWPTQLEPLTAEDEKEYRSGVSRNWSILSDHNVMGLRICVRCQKKLPEKVTWVLAAIGDSKKFIVEAHEKWEARQAEESHREEMVDRMNKLIMDAVNEVVDLPMSAAGIDFSKVTLRQFIDAMTPGNKVLSGLSRPPTFSITSGGAYVENNG